MKGGNGKSTWNSCATAILVAKRLQESEFSKYDQPAKLSKIKNGLSNAEYVALLPDGSVVVSDKVNNRIQIFDGDGTFSRTLVKRGRPLGIATNRSGQLVITDLHRKQTQVGVYTVDGRCLRLFDPTCEDDIRPSTPCYVSVDPFDRILVSDRENQCVKVFDERGLFLTRMGSRDPGDDRLAFPRGLCCDSKGNVMVCDTGHCRLALFSADGRFQQNLLTSKHGLSSPRDVALNRTSGRLVVAQHNSSASSSFRKIRIYEIEKI
ncbi:hypothetical protein CAPTEDRAFT_183785 [Capitella teleta]|uniref:SMP-30/Gluconolactonase/LRE-like region domain-containing protein n=1 Tax=Capitella teleta TaxID=283909 RepID=R7V885_CAPTE|nr:hypothetical protein CAPTEDRAFT_183785 [Capitella teleta]|eukprot:ELU11980.1 hypothetical protein CAPTEDRAFT_183785 [Capitella teleta]